VKVGTKSLIFGVHSVIWHPLTVLFAWVHLYGLPNYREVLCIFIHDWGYFGCADMDDEEGSMHPELAGKIARKFFGVTYGDLCLYHSRRYSECQGKLPSRLCYADKLSIAYDPMWLYLLRANLTGELPMYREASDTHGMFPRDRSNKEWFIWLRAHMVEIGNSGAELSRCGYSTVLRH